MLREKTSQCVVISGNKIPKRNKTLHFSISGLSGSGKTESCKYIVQHILSRSLSIEAALNVKINQVKEKLD
jgi:myosin heavy subunit